ncbi:hypothetical protein BKA65DRAFT_492601 [Rhexocercosporidium sp. MPI-PUGE-AT-0058]|nr:hypothetical protein BKA65DRAFT_492601 [Rhexocercosporidium sp. MPI-PUGE-AT-0058]
MTLESNTQRACFLLVTFIVLGGEVQFDSDYSVGDDASNFSSSRIKLLLKLRFSTHEISCSQSVSLMPFRIRLLKDMVT